MALYFVQHGEALSKDVDPERSLSETGRKNSKKMAEYLAANAISIKTICHSGKKRALQTAEIFAGLLGDCEIVQNDGMGPKDDVVGFANTITDETMYVGHLPHLGRLVTFLLSGDEDADVVKVTNSGIICLDKSDSGSGTGYQLMWYLTPCLT